MVVDKDSKAEYREVALGVSIDGMRVVTGGLHAGERIVVKGLQRVRPGAVLAPEVVAMGFASSATEGSTALGQACSRCSLRERRAIIANDRIELSGADHDRPRRDPCAPRPGHQRDSVMNFSRFFIDRPDLRRSAVDADLRGGAAVAAGAAISEYPEVAPPTVVVRAQYPGANPKVIAETVSTPIEEQINGVEGMLYMSSQATTDGLMTLNVTFRLGTDPDKAQQLVQNRVAQAEPRLPNEVRTLGITTIKSAPDLTMVVHLLSPNGRYDMTYLRNYAVLNVKDRLARIEGVGQVQLFGSGDYSMRVWLDPQKVAERGLSASDVVREIRAQNVQAAAGVVGASPNETGLDLQLSINAQGRLQT